MHNLFLLCWIWIFSNSAQKQLPPIACPTKGKKYMASLVKLMIVGMFVAMQSSFAGIDRYCPPTTVPDGGATALLAALSFGGLMIGRNLLRKR
jgi:hypothetical protein